MTVGLCDVDWHGYPNLALMRLASYHRLRCDAVSWFVPLCLYDRVYASKVFTFTPDNTVLPSHDIKALARWCNIVSVRRSCAFSEYRYLSIDGRSKCGKQRQ